MPGQLAQSRRSPKSAGKRRRRSQIGSKAAAARGGRLAAAGRGGAALPPRMTDNDSARALSLLFTFFDAANNNSARSHNNCQQSAVALIFGYNLIFKLAENVEHFRPLRRLRVAAAVAVKAGRFGSGSPNNPTGGGLQLKRSSIGHSVAPGH